jgi:hypothetical protein
MSYPCKRCTNEARFLVNDMVSGETDAYCNDHLGGNSDVPLGRSTPDQCERCGAEPPVVVLEALADGQSLTLGSNCLLMFGRESWLGAEPEMREAIDALIGAPGPAAPGGTKPSSRGRQRRAQARPVADHRVQPEPPGVVDGVAVDDTGATPPAAAEADSTRGAA